MYINIISIYIIGVYIIKVGIDRQIEKERKE